MSSSVPEDGPRSDQSAQPDRRIGRQVADDPEAELAAPFDPVGEPARRGAGPDDQDVARL